MALLTGTFTLSANGSTSLTLNRNELSALVSDSYFSMQSVWKKVIIKYANETQFCDVMFNGQNGIGKLSIPAKTLNGVLEIQSITIVDFMNGRYVMTQGQIPSHMSYNVVASGGIEYSGTVVDNFLLADDSDFIITDSGEFINLNA